MARIAGVNLPNEKRIEVGLTSIYGIGRKLSLRILKESNVDLNKRVKDLSEQEVTVLRELIARFPTEGDLKRKITIDIKHLQEIGCHRGIRHKKGLPVRGQHTRSNCRTKKGKAKTVANKKVITK